MQKSSGCALPWGAGGFGEGEKICDRFPPIAIYDDFGTRGAGGALGGPLEALGAEEKKICDRFPPIAIYDGFGTGGAGGAGRRWGRWEALEGGALGRRWDRAKKTPKICFACGALEKDTKKKIPPAAGF